MPPINSTTTSIDGSFTTASASFVHAGARGDQLRVALQEANEWRSDVPAPEQADGNRIVRLEGHHP
jgi:hypothetical protein